MRKHRFVACALLASTAVAFASAGCGAGPSTTTSASTDEALSALGPNEILGSIAYGQTVGPIDYVSAPGDHYRAWRFTGNAGDSITATVRSPSGGYPRVWLLSSTFATIQTGKYGHGTTSTTILTYPLPTDGVFYVAFRDVNLAPGTFYVDLTGPSADAGVPDAGSDSGVSDAGTDGSGHDAGGDAAHSGGFTFATPRDLQTDTNPNGLATLDANGDGLLDLAVSSSNDAAGVSVINLFLGDGHGGFTRGSSNGVSLPSTVITGDFDGDGKTDLASGAFDGQGGLSISVLLSNGDGTFRRTSIPGTNYWTGIVSAADFDKDGRADLIAPYLNDPGDTSLGMKLLLAPDFTQSVQVDVMDRAVAAADADGDGNADIVSNGGVVFGDGAGHFGAPLRFRRGDDGSTVLVTDVNHDGRPDVVLTSATAARITVLLNSGSRTFGPATSFAVLATGPKGLAAADFDGDGNVDLAVGVDDRNLTVETPTISVLPGDGAGGFGAPLAIGVSGGSPDAVVATDLNGDGKSDLIGTNASGSSFSVLVNDR